MSNPYRDKLLTIQIHPDATPSRTKRNYYDRDAVHSAFGEDAEERMMDETKGLGPAYRGPDGIYRKNRHKEWERASAKELDQTYLAGDTEQAL